ncbi:inositol monophosphatase family protein [Albidovulum sp.]
MRSDLARALELTAGAAQVALRHFHGTLGIDIKADESPVTVADRETETALRRAIAETFPGDGIYGEEFGSEGMERARIWVVDPIDGTRSFIAGVPLFGLLLALVADGVPELGIVRLPALGRVYAAARGQGARRDGCPIRTSGVTRLDAAMLFVNEGEKIHADRPDLFARLMGAGRLRRLSYDCQPHALLAEGRVDAVVDYRLQPYDYLPLVPLIEEAGGVITDWQGRPLGFGRDVAVVSAASPDLHRELLALLNS